MGEIFVEKREELIRIAVKENDELVECLVEEKTIEPQIGEVYKARVKNIIPAINSIFLDIGLAKEAYMYYSEELKRTGVKKGQELLVEVLKEPLGNKGAKVSNKVNILGRYIVLTIGVEGITISKRISDMEQRQRLINLTKPIKGIEIVYRTEAETATDEELLSELNSLLEKKEEMENKLRYSTTIGKVKSNSMILRFLEELDDRKTRIIADDYKLLENIKNLLKEKKAIEFKFYESKRTLFDYSGIEKEIIKLFEIISAKKPVISIQELIYEIGMLIDDENSFIATAARNNVPIFAPGIIDCMIGLQLWIFSQDHDFTISAAGDMPYLSDIVFGSKKVGGILLGGGLTKHYTLASNILNGGLDCAIQITMDRPEAGSLGGAPLEEAKSWSKAKCGSNLATVVGDVTIIFPLIYAAALDKI